MENRSKRKSIAEQTLEVIKNGYYLNKDGSKIDISENQTYAEAHTKTYKPEETDKLIQQSKYKLYDQNAIISVSRESTVACVLRLLAEGHEDVVYLNFASAKNPGGGFLGGSQAQEESIARSTGMYPCLKASTEYYETNRSVNSAYYTDYIIYSPNVPIFRSDSGQFLQEAQKAAIITAPAVNCSIGKQGREQKAEEVKRIMKQRMHKILAIANAQGHSTIVLGAWGCGVFQNNPDEVSLWFREVIEAAFTKAFRNIVFAIYSKSEAMIAPFEHEFRNKGQ